MTYFTAEQKDRVELLARALESGKYEQTNGLLRQDGPNGWQYCCLGVACDLYHEKTERGQWDSDTFLAGGGTQSSSTELVEEVREWYGFLDMNPALVVKDGTPDENHDRAAGLNDGGWSFEEIAQGLRKLIA